MYCRPLNTRSSAILPIAPLARDDPTWPWQILQCPTCLCESPMSDYKLKASLRLTTRKLLAYTASRSQHHQLKRCSLCTAYHPRGLSVVAGKTTTFRAMAANKDSYNTPHVSNSFDPHFSPRSRLTSTSQQRTFHTAPKDGRTNGKPGNLTDCRKLTQFLVRHSLSRLTSDRSSRQIAPRRGLCGRARHTPLRDMARKLDCDLGDGYARYVHPKIPAAGIHGHGLSTS